MPHVVTISPDGSLSCLQPKPGKGVDFLGLGRAEINRASEIVWSVEQQAWSVRILRGLLAGCTLTTTMWREEGCQGAPAGMEPVSMPGSVYYFRDYDDAVRAEIVFLDQVRRVRGAKALETKE